MRFNLTWALCFAVVAVACSKAEPTSTSNEAVEAKPSDCVAACVRARQMEAIGADAIEANCREQCSENPTAYP